MNAVPIALFGIFSFLLTYKFYHVYLAKKIFKTDDGALTPAHQLSDGIDYVPTKKSVLWGHHFSSIAGAAPIVGPAIAVIWGWLPAFLWVLIGGIFIGAVHDGGTLILSAKRQGKSIAEISGGLITPKAKIYFLGIIFFLIWTVIAVFAFVIAVLFHKYPQTVIPVNAQIILAVALGVFSYKKNISLLIPSILCLLILYALIPVGIKYPISLSGLTNYPILVWLIFLMIYSFVASVLPVWALLQPRDFINSHQLIVGLLAIYIGFFILQPDLVAPVINPSPSGAPMLWPFLFITIACGAISGFHGLVSSGTTSKQLDKMSDACSIGCGSMLGESALALMAILACTAGFANFESWQAHYISWNAASGFAQKLSAFVEGTALFLSQLSIEREFAKSVVVILVISFAATSLDTAARIQRLILSEIGSAVFKKKNFLENRFSASFIAVGTAAALALSAGKSGQGGLILWPLFGASNQLIAALSLAILSYWLIKQKQNFWITFIPFVFVMALVSSAMVYNLIEYYQSKKFLLLTSQFLVLILVIGFFREIMIAYKKPKVNF